MRAIFLTDLHFRQDPLSFNEALMLIDQERPEVVILGGDFDDRELADRFINKVSQRCVLVLFILGNNDEFEPYELQSLNNGNVLYLDGSAVAWLHDADVVFCGISRNIALSSKPFRKSPEQYLDSARKITQYIGNNRFSLEVLTIHEVPRELADLAKQRGIIQSYNEKIADTVSQAVKSISPDVVLCGHLHTEYLAAKVVNDGGNILQILTCWSRYRTYVEIYAHIDRGIHIQVKKFPNVDEPLETILFIPNNQQYEEITNEQ